MTEKERYALYKERLYNGLSGYSTPSRFTFDEWVQNKEIANNWLIKQVKK